MSLGIETDTNQSASGQDNHYIKKAGAFIR